MTQQKNSLLAAYRHTAFALAMASIFVFSPDAMAQVGAAQVATNLTNAGNSFLNLIAISAQLAGFTAVLLGTWAIKKAGAENDQRPEEKKKAFFYILAGVAAVGLPALVGMGATTLFGSTSGMLNGPGATLRVN